MPPNAIGFPAAMILNEVVPGVGVNVVDQASLRLLPFEPLIWFSELYRHDRSLPFSVTQSAPEDADSCATVNAGIVAASLERLPEAPTAVIKAIAAVPRTSRNIPFLRIAPPQ